MPAVVFVLLCLAIPWIWGFVVAAVYAWRDRRPSGVLRGRPPTDFSI